MRVEVDIKSLYGDVAKIGDIPAYVEAAEAKAGKGNDVVITGQGPVWLYLCVAHALHGVAKSLTYESPVTGPVEIFNHDPF